MSFMRIASLFAKNKNGRRGVAIELALAVMFVSLALGALIVSTAVIGAKQTRRIKDDIKSELAIDEIGQSFCSAVKNGEDLDAWCASLTSHTAEYEISDAQGGTQRISLSLYGEEDKLMLSMILEASADGNSFVIKKWTHHI